MQVPDSTQDPNRAKIESQLHDVAQNLGRVAETEHILQFFAYEHLPAHLQAASKPFGDLAREIVHGERALPRNPERTVALRKLLEAKDAAVRALVAKA